MAFKRWWGSSAVLPKHINKKDRMADPLIRKRKQQAKDWFEALRDQICADFERLETEIILNDETRDLNAGQFQRTAWKREDDENSNEDRGGGVMAVMRGGRLFEKVGVNCSTVYGQFSEEFASNIPGAMENDRQFWASGISLVAHPRSPLVPIAHMNTRMIVTSKSWFGGGGDLTPVFPVEADTNAFHDAFKQACDPFDATYYPRFKDWCDRYFYLPHRREMRGVGGIFFDYLDDHGWDQDFAFVQSVGDAFRNIYCELITRHMNEPWTQAQKHAQKVKRGRYAEFNLLYDRGTKFGLQTGGNVEAILMSLPPETVWE